MRVLALLIGVILLAPGACALAFMGIGAFSLPSLGTGIWSDSSFWGFMFIALAGWSVCFLISYGGYRLIRSALKPPAPPPRN